MKTLLLGVLALATQNPSTEVGFKLVETGTQTKFKQGGAFVLRTDQEYFNYLKKRGFESRRAPQIDFRQSQLVAVHIGDEPTEGYTFRVVKVLRKNPTTTDIEVVLDRPIITNAAQIVRDPQSTSVGDPLFSTRKKTFPYVIIATERFPGTVRVRVVEPENGGGR